MQDFLSNDQDLPIASFQFLNYDSKSVRNIETLIIILSVRYEIIFNLAIVKKIEVIVPKCPIETFFVLDKIIRNLFWERILKDVNFAKYDFSKFPKHDLTLQKCQKSRICRIELNHSARLVLQDGPDVLIKSIQT